MPATNVNLSVHRPVLLTLAPLAGWVAASRGLVLGTRVAPQNESYLFALVVLPLTFLGAIYYPWQALEPIRWLQIVVLLNPLVYTCEGFRAALTDGVAHMSLLRRLRRAGRVRRRADLARHRRIRQAHHRLTDRDSLSAA